MDESQQTSPAANTTATHRDRLERSPRQEPALVHYRRILWRRRLLIGLGSLLPALLLAVVLAMWPSKYTATFVYERPLTESAYNVLLRRFYSSENLDKIIGRLQQANLSDYALGLQEAQTEQSLEKLIRFRVVPAHPKRLQTTDPTVSQRISAFEAQLLYIEITGDSKMDMHAVSAVIIGNVEEVLPIYDIRKNLRDSIQQFKNRLAEIEENRFTLSLDLEMVTARLAKLQGLGGPSEGDESNVVLQFTDVKGSREFLPLSYQVRAVQAKIIDLQETLNADDKRYDYYRKVLAIDNRLLRRIEDNLLNYYTAQEFLTFLGEELLAAQEEPLADYLKSYISKTENLIMVNARAAENPVVYPVSKHIASRSALALIILLMFTTLVAVLLEYRREQLSPLDTPSNA